MDVAVACEVPKVRVHGAGVGKTRVSVDPRPGVIVKEPLVLLPFPPPKHDVVIFFSFCRYRAPVVRVVPKLQVPVEVPAHVGPVSRLVGFMESLGKRMLVVRPHEQPRSGNLLRPGTTYNSTWLPDDGRGRGRRRRRRRGAKPAQRALVWACLALPARQMDLPCTALAREQISITTASDDGQRVEADGALPRGRNRVPLDVLEEHDLALRNELRKDLLRALERPPQVHPHHLGREWSPRRL